jgi:phage terminase small subunit
MSNCPRAFPLKQRLFIEAYLVSGSFTKAAIAAGCKERSAHAVGWKWSYAKIRAEIDACLASTLDRYAVTSDRIIRELALIGFGNIDDVAGPTAGWSSTSARRRASRWPPVDRDRRR